MHRHHHAAFRIAVCCVIAFAATHRTHGQSFQIPISVKNGSALTRTGESASFGVPIPEAANVLNSETLRVRDAAQQLVPAQFKVLSRWGGPRQDTTKKLKWVLVTLNTTVPPNGSVPYFLTTGTGGTYTGITTASTTTTITVTTAPGVVFTLRKNAFTLFDAVALNGQPVLAAPGGLEFINSLGNAASPTITSVTTLEDSGSRRVVARQKGTLGGLGFTVRWYFAAGRSDVAVDFRLENSNAYGLFSASIPDGQIYFKKLALTLPVAGSGHTVASTVAARPSPTGQTYDLRQLWSSTLAQNLNLQSGFAFTEYINGAVVGTGNRYGGALDLSNPTNGVTATLDRFWQMVPKALKAEGSALKVVLFPEWGHGPEFGGQYGTPSSPTAIDPLASTNYRFEGGRWRTFHMVFDFHAAGPRAPAEVADAGTRAATPLMGLADPAKIRESGALGSLWIEKRTNWTSPAETRYEQFYSMMVDDSASDNVTNIGHVGLPSFVNRGGTYGGVQAYGWDCYGDLPWGDGYCSLHYDWPGSMLSGFLRSGDYRFFDRGRDMAVYRRDYGQNHSTNVNEWWRGAQFYEKGWWHGNATWGQQSHTWLTGVLLHHVMTGDEGSRESAVECIDFIIRNPPKLWDGYWGARIQGWAIDVLVDGYNYLGSQMFLDEARLGVARYQTLELLDGGHGYHINPGNGATAPWQENIVFIAICRYAIAARDSQFFPLLQRMRNFYTTECIVAPTGPASATTLPYVYGDWNPVTHGYNPSVHLAWPMCDALAWSSVLLNSGPDYGASYALFETLGRYWQSSAGGTGVNYANPATWSAVTMRPFMYPGSETKVISNALRWGLAHMWVRTMRDGTL